MMRRNKLRTAVVAVVMLMGTGASMAQTVACDPAVSSVLDKQRQAYVAAEGDFASQNFSKRPGSFASTTCLDNLMKGGGMDIFFKPPSIDGILGMVKNLACQQASQIFNSLMGGSGINGALSSLTGLGAPAVAFGMRPSTTSIPDATLRGLFR
jgi:hypothetical protein